MPQVKIVARNFMDMVAALPAMKLDKLYDSTFICEAVLRFFIMFLCIFFQTFGFNVSKCKYYFYSLDGFYLFYRRSLPPLAKKYVLQMLYLEIPVTAKSMGEWVLPDGMSKHKVAISRLLQLRIFIDVVDRFAKEYPLKSKIIYSKSVKL